MQRRDGHASRSVQPDPARRRRAALAVAVAAIGIAALASPSVARASDDSADGEPSPFRMRPNPTSTAAPRHAFEAVLDVAYVQPTGGVSEGHAVQDALGGGVELALGLGYRFAPLWSLDLRGDFHDSEGRGTGSTGDARGLAIVAGPTFHVLPYEFMDPYLSLGTGYRLLVEQRDGVETHPTTMGLDVLRVQVGLDVRVSSNVGLGLYLAGDVTTFLWSSSGSSFGTLSGGPDVSVFFSGGAQARFDIGGARERLPTVTASR